MTNTPVKVQTHGKSYALKQYTRSILNLPKHHNTLSLHLNYQKHSFKLPAINIYICTAQQLN